MMKIIISLGVKGGETVNQFDRKNLTDDWKICLIALVVGLVIAAIMWMLTHLSFFLTWMAITIASIPIWKQVAEWAKKKYPNDLLTDAVFTYLFYDDNDEYLFQETIES